MRVSFWALFCQEGNENPFVWVLQSQSQITVNCNSKKNLGVGGVRVTLAFGSDGEIPVTYRFQEMVYSRPLLKVNYFISP